MPDSEVEAEFNDELDHYLLDWEKSLREHLAVAEEVSSEMEQSPTEENGDARLGETAETTRMSTDTEGHEHKPKGSPEGGQFTGSGESNHAQSPEKTTTPATFRWAAKQLHALWSNGSYGSFEQSHWTAKAKKIYDAPRTIEGVLSAIVNKPSMLQGALADKQWVALAEKTLAVLKEKHLSDTLPDY